jgi:23S rRNA U2552 (ribose-2'-O)-methylase RlmE/FtsJ
VSNDDTGVDFSVIDPSNQTTIVHSNTKQKSFSFIAEMTGNYDLHFDNVVYSDYAKTVTLNYNVTHYIMGLPQEQFLLVVIAIVALIGVVIYVALMPK